MQKSFRAAALIVAAASVLSAQFSTGGTAPTIADIVAARVARLTKLLTLTTAQAASATSLFTTEETALSTIRTSLAAARTALTTAVEANSGISAAATAIGNLVTQQELAEGTAEGMFYAELTTDQQTKYKELLAAGLDNGGGPGGHGGPGGGPPHR